MAPADAPYPRRPVASSSTFRRDPLRNAGGGALLRWAPLLAWGGFLTFLATRPADRLPELPWGFPGSDKLLHAVCYAPLGLLLQRALGLRRALPAVLAGAAIGAGWGLLDEWLQMGAPGREPGWGDLLADTAGAAAAAWIAWRFGLGRRAKRTLRYH